MPYDDPISEYDGLVLNEDKYGWARELEEIRSWNLCGKYVSILGMDNPDTVMPPTWVEIMQLRDAFIHSGAKSVDYIYYENDTFLADH